MHLGDLYSPLRELDWRYLRAMEILDGTFRLEPEDDPTVRRYLQFRRRLDRSNTRRTREALSRGFPDVITAHRIRADEDLAAIVSARILAGQTNSEIAALTGHLPSAIGTFEQLFFHVRDRMHATVWIACTALAPNPILGAGRRLTESEQRTFALKYVAYHGGALVLDAFLAHQAPGDSPARPDQVRDWLDQSFAGSISISLWTHLDDVLRAIDAGALRSVFAMWNSQPTETATSSTYSVDMEAVDKAVADYWVSISSEGP